MMARRSKNRPRNGRLGLKVLSPPVEPTTECGSYQCKEESRDQIRTVPNCKKFTMNKLFHDRHNVH
jgi:hypothetical protein